MESGNQDLHFGPEPIQLRSMPRETLQQELPNEMTSTRHHQLEVEIVISGLIVHLDFSALAKSINQENSN